MKILILSPYYSPNINPRAHRWTSIAEHWAKNGHEIQVITSINKNFPRQHKLNGVKIHRVGFNSLKDILYHFSKNTTKRGEAGQKKKNAGRKGAILQWINDKILRQIYFPDDAFTWYYPTKKVIKKLLKEEKFDVLVSSSVPFTTHLLALNTRKEYPNLKWIADTGDPFAFQPMHPMNNQFLYGRLSKRMEKRVALEADFITLTNEGAKKLYENFFAQQKEKFIVIPPVLRSSSPIQRLNSEPQHSSIKISYFGSFFRNIREPRPLLQFFDRLVKNYPEYDKKLEFHFYGNIFENFLQDFSDFPDLEDKLFLHGLISSEEVKVKMQETDFLMNIGNATDFQLPSKSVDYMLSGKPILNFISIKTDTFKNFFKNYDLIENYEVGNYEKEVESLYLFLQKNLGMQQEIEIIEKNTSKFRVENIAKKYMQLIGEK